MNPEALTIEVVVLAGSGDPPMWSFKAGMPARPVVHCTGPRILVLETLGRFVELFTEESAPLAKPGVP